ncbi:MAG: DNA-binding response regulator [Bacteroidia bacterium]
MMRDEESLETPAFAIARREASLLLQNYTATSSPEPENLRLSQATVLLVEDNPDMQFLLRQILSEKYRIYTAGNGQEGLQIAQNKNIDLIISDILMPEMDGLTFCEKIKLNFSTSHIPVILLTARILPQHKKSGFLKGADDYITKPFDSELLKIRVENLLQQRQKLREIFSREFMLTPRYEKITSPDQVFLKKLVDIMNENLAEPDFNIDKMSKMMYLSHMHFIRKVKQLTGKKPVDLLKSFRMKKARDLLEQKNLSIADVAFKVGFDLPNSFSRAFKKEFNITPTEFVKSLPDTNSEVLEEILQD